MIWGVHQADLVAYCDACLSGLGFFFERSAEGFQCHVPESPHKDTIFYFEALAIVSVINAVSWMQPIPSRLLIFSDNTNSVDIFSSLCSLPPYNNLLKFTVSLLIAHDISLRVAPELTTGSWIHSLDSRMIGHSPCALDSPYRNFNPHVEHWGSSCGAPGIRNAQATQMEGLDNGTFGQ